jgi:hypothetical protein
MANENLFLTAKTTLVIKPKTIAIEAFNYKGFDDLKNLIDFVGSTPKIEIQLGQVVLSFRKHVVKPESIILRNAYGEVSRVMDYKEANAIYDIAAQSDFKPELKNKVQAKPEKKK